MWFSTLFSTIVAHEGRERGKEGKEGRDGMLCSIDAKTTCREGRRKKKEERIKNDEC